MANFSKQAYNDILKKDIEQSRGSNALYRNIAAVKAVSEAIRTTLGPRGLSKMIVDNLGDVVVTNDGAKVLEDLLIENPAARMVKELSKTIKKNVGDGASSCVLFLGALMGKVEEIHSSGIPPTQIYQGFNQALKECKKFLDEVSRDLDLNDEKILHEIVDSALETKNTYNAKETLTEIIVKTILNIRTEQDGKSIVDMDNVQIIKKEGDELKNSTWIAGVIVDKEIVNPMMPKIVKNAKIALIDAALEIVKTDFSSEIEITNPSSMNDFLQQEHSIIEKLIDSLVSAGTTVVFCQKGIDELAQNFLAKHGILAVRRVKHSDMKKLAQATGATIITQIKQINEKDLGKAEIVVEKKVGNDTMVFIEKCLNPKAITVLIRGATEELIDDAERSLKNGIAVLRTIFETPKIVGGGGSIEVALRKHLTDYAKTVGGKEQIAIEGFADALEIIPKVLIENSGADPLDILTTMRAKVDYSAGKIIGFNSKDNQLVDTYKKGIIDSLEVKKHIYSAATEIAIIFTRVDDYIRAAH